jgi:hypothetical protein
MFAEIDAEHLRSVGPPDRSWRKAQYASGVINGERSVKEEFSLVG